MGSSVIINIPSSSSSSSRVQQTVENEGEDRVDTEVAEAKFSDRNRPCRKLGHHEVPRLILNNVENDKLLMSLKRGIGEFNKGENQLNLEIEQLERELLMLMVAKGLKGDKLENFVEEKGIKGFEVLKLNDKLKDLRIGIEEPKKCEKGKILETDIARQKQLVLVVDEAINESEKKLCKEIELLESMLERGSYGLLDLQMMMEEVKGLKGSEKMVSEIKMKMGELETELCELKNAIFELKGKKSKELMGCVQKEEEDKELKCDEHLEEDEEVENNTSKIKWGSIFASVGAFAVTTAAVFFMGRSRVVAKSERMNRGQTG